MTIRFSALAAVVLLAFAGPVAARGPKRAAKPPAKADRPALVAAGKLPAYFDPNDLSKEPVLSAESAVLMDADTDQILWEHNADARRFPASTTKILTGLLFAERSKPDDVITCMDPNITKVEESSLHIKPWEKFTAKDLLYGLMLRSANDGAVVIAQTVSGSVPKFADLMNERARQLGATNSHFTNPNGLPDPNHYTTARDLALIARAALADPRFADAVGTPRRTIARSKVSRDTIVQTKGKDFYKKFPGADGVKTGWTRAAGHCFVGSATRNGRRLLSVILGAKSSAISDTIPLMSWGFQRFPAQQLAIKGHDAGTFSVRGGVHPVVGVVAGADLRASYDRFAPPTTFKTELQPAADPLEAPIARGQEVGRLIARVGSVEAANVPLLASDDVARSPVAAVTQGAGRFFGGAAIALAVVGVGVVGTTVAKSARRRGRRVPSARRRVNRARPSRGRRPDRDPGRYAGRPGNAGPYR